MTLFIGDRPVAELPEDVFAQEAAIELRAADGRKLVRLIAEPVKSNPWADGPWDENALVPWQPGWTAEDLERHSGGGEGKPLAEIWAKLGVK